MTISALVDKIVSELETGRTVVADFPDGLGRAGIVGK
jgi:hypothetical protein